MAINHAILLTGHAPKGSALAKMRMAYLRSLRGRGRTIESELRRRDIIDKISRGETRMTYNPEGRYTMYGGFDPMAIVGPYLKFTGNWIQNSLMSSKQQKDELEYLRRLKKMRGGKFEPATDIVDFLAGPIGWIKMGIRKKRQREIDNLKKELNL